MAITVGTDTYVLVTDADAYFEKRLFVEAWETADTATKEKALMMATAKIDMQPLRGRKATLEQELQFPRSIHVDTAYPYTNPYYDPLKGNTPVYPAWYTEEEVSRDVVYATCEEALAILKGAETANQRAELQRQGVSTFRLGNLSESFTGGSTGYRLLSVEAAQLLSRYLGGSRSIV